MIHKHFKVGPLQCNCSIIADPVSKKALVVDPGGDAQLILDALTADELQPIALIHTHAHFDHILAAGAIKDATGAPIRVHRDDWLLWQALEAQCAWFNVPYHPLPDPDTTLDDEEMLNCCDGVALHTPGHTMGSMSFWFASHKLLIAGDTLFKGSIGRTDLPGGNFEQLAHSIRHRLYNLADDAMVITGHGPPTSLAHERDTNPFIAAQ